MSGSYILSLHDKLRGTRRDFIVFVIFNKYKEGGYETEKNTDTDIDILQHLSHK